MFVFPAFNNSFKQRKRTFKCCKLCRNKRIRCSLSSGYDKLGCDNCKINYLSCDLVDPSASKELCDVAESPNESPTNVEPDPIINTTSENTRSQTPVESTQSSNLQAVAPPAFTESTFDSNLKDSNIPAKKPAFKLDLREPKASFTFNNDDMPSSTTPFLNKNSANTSINQFNNSNIKSNPIVPSHPIPVSQIPPQYPSTISQSYLKQTFNFNITEYNSKNIKFVGTSDPTAVFAQFNNSLSRNSKLLKIPTSNKRLSKFNRFFENINSNSSSDIPIVNACAPRPKLRKRNSQSEHPMEAKRQKINGKGMIRNDESFEDLRKITIEANKSSNQTIGLYISNPPKITEKVISSPFLFQYLLSINAFNLNLSIFTQFKLCKIFMWKVNSIFPILNEYEFWDLYNSNKLSTLLLYSVILVAARDDFAIPLLKDEGITNLKFFLDDLEDKIRGFLMCDIETDKLSLLQIHLLLHFHTRNCETGLEKCSIDLSIVLSYAMSLGIHHKQQAINSTSTVNSKDQQNYLCKLWWTIVVLDRMNTIVNSRAMLVNKKDISIDFPKDDKNMLILIDCAIKLEKMLSIYQPHGDKRVIPKDIDNDDELDYFTLLNPHAHGNSNSPESLPSTPTFETFDKDYYTEKSIRNLKAILQNTTIILSQKRHYDDPDVPKSIPDHNNSVAASRILTIIRTQGHYIPQIPFIPYAISLTMTIFLRIGFKKIVAEKNEGPEMVNHYDWKDSIVELNKLSDKWWFAGEMTKMGKWFFSKFESELSIIKKKNTDDKDQKSKPKDVEKNDKEISRDERIQELKTAEAQIEIEKKDNLKIQSIISDEKDQMSPISALLNNENLPSLFSNSNTTSNTSSVNNSTNSSNPHTDANSITNNEDISLSQFELDSYDLYEIFNDLPNVNQILESFNSNVEINFNHDDLQF